MITEFEHMSVWWLVGGFVASAIVLVIERQWLR